MNLGENNSNTTTAFFRKFFSKRIVFGLLFIALVIVGVKSSKLVKTKGYDGLWDFISTVSSNYLDGMDANPESISIEIKDKDIKILEKNRQQAIDRGIIINELDGEYVSGTLDYKGKKIKIKLRLKGHMTDHIETDNKWSFRIKVKGNDNFMGMTRFSIQQPGTRGYLYEWIYHELMKREDIIALRYKFINVSVNGKDWGIYAVEENFENELIENSNRKKGPILRLNPDLYWVKRYNGVKHEPVLAEFASYYSANFEAYQEDKVLIDSIQKQYYLKGIALAEGFRNKKLTVSEVFDVNRLAKFHAIIDLVGGIHSIDWSDIKYYYNPITAKLEPVAYESFSNFTINKITGNYKFVSIDSSEYYENWHTAIFSDPVFFTEYVKNLERISEPKFLDDFFATSNTDLNENLKILYKEYPYKKFETKSYYRNQKMIKKILEGDKSLHAYFEKKENNELLLQIGNIESLPIEVKSITIGKDQFKSNNPIILASKQEGRPVQYKRVSFSCLINPKWSDSLINEMKVDYCVLGSSVSKQTNVFPFPHTDKEFIVEDLKNKQSTVQNFSFIEVNSAQKHIYIHPGNNVIASDLIFPAGYTVIANVGVVLDIKNKAKVISYSPMIFTGDEEKAIVIKSSDSTGQGIQVINAGKSIFQFVSIENIPKIYDNQWSRTGGLTFYESPVEFKRCGFYNCKAEDAISVIRSDFSFANCFFNKMVDDAIDIDFSNGTIIKCTFEVCGENALDITMSSVQMEAVNIRQARNKALNVKSGSSITGTYVGVYNSEIAISAEDLSEINLGFVTIADSKTGITAYKNKKGGGHPTIRMKDLTFKNVKTNYLKEKKASLTINGVEIKDEVKDVEAIIKK